MKYYLLLINMALAAVVASQPISGTVTDSNSEPLIGASVLLDQSGNGTVTDINGKFTLEATASDRQIILSYIGFISDTLKIATLGSANIVLEENSEELDEVVVKSSSTFIDNLEPIHAEVITSKELMKAACCNLSETFETNASVDVSFTDAVTGTKTIRMLGLDGRYTLINRENIPNVRGYNSRQGLNLIPGTWIQSIDIGKGAGTVVNGYESMTGQINVELKKPESSEKLFLNTYVNSFGRTEINANTSYRLNEKWSGAVLAHGNYFWNEIDRNDDGFMDLPKGRQFNIMNRYKYQGETVESQLGLHVVRNEKAGGQLGFDFADDAATSPLYGYANQSTRVELFGKTGFMFPETPYKGWGFIYSGAIHDFNMDFGKNHHKGQERTLYLNAIHQNIIGNTFHQIKTGASLLIDDIDESYTDTPFVDTTFLRTEVVPGTFAEYSFLPNDDFTLLTGVRLDYHNLYGLYFTPRVHLRYAYANEGTLRLSAGKGYRTPNPIVDNNQFFLSSRRLVIEEKLKPEKSWNLGGSVVQEINLGEQKLDIIADYFYTQFINSTVADLDQSASEIRFYNLKGDAFANSAQLEVGTTLGPYLNTKAAYKWYDVKSTIDGEMRAVPFVSKHRAFWNLSYASKFDVWQADLTFQWFGRKRLPDTSDKPTEFQKDAYSPDFTNLNAQVSRSFRWGSIYLGSENLLDFRQDDPIIDPQNPFGSDFDASMAWGPVAGRLVYLGLRFKLD